MIVPLALLLLTQTTNAPDLPPGINGAVVGTMYLVETKLQANDFVGAAKEAELLPKRQVKIGWDANSIPQARREELKSAFDKAAAVWSGTANIQIEEAADPDIRVSFVNDLPKLANQEFPQGATLEWKEGPERLDLTIALHRLDTKDDITPEDVYNEAAYSIGQYLGLTRIPKFGTFSSRTDQDTTAKVAINDYEVKLSQTTLDAADQLRQLVASKIAVAVKRPEMTVSTAEISGVTGTQYLPLDFSFTVENRGDADLKLFVLPDCGCLQPHTPPIIKPHSSGTILADVNTGAFPGLQNHSLFIYTNDPGFPLAEIPVHMNIETLYRFVHAGPDGLQIGPNGLDMDVYLFFSDKATIVPLTASILGPNASVKFDKWSGTLPFDDVAKGAPESGYKFHIHFAPSKVDGRIYTTLQVGTDNESFQELTYSFNLQKGIVAMPGQVYFGRLTGHTAKASFDIARPGKPFHIVKVVPADSRLTAVVHSLGKDDEYRVDLLFNGSVDFTGLKSTVKVVTSDPSQPSIVVPVSGSGR